MAIEGTPSRTCLNPDRLFLLGQIRFDKMIVRAKGHYLYDADGGAYLDFVAQYGAVPFGYNPDILWRRLEDVRQREEPSFVQPLLSPGAEALAEELVNVAPGHLRNVVFTNSGAESMEAGIKLVRAATGRSVILSTLSGFHGKTLGAVSATGNPRYRKPFRVDTRFFEHIPYNDLPTLDARLARRDLAAFVVEAVQGEGGMIMPDPGYLRTAAEMCRRTGTLFMLDEVQTGLGRTGRLFAAEHEGLEVDVLLLAKALGGGLVPLGACLCTEKVWTRDFGFCHSSTFANNHLTCSVGLATLQHLLDDDRRLIREVAEKGEYLKRGLQDLVIRYPRAFTEASGMGLMQGVRLAPWNGEESYFVGHASSSGFAVPLVCGYLLNEHGILTAPAFNNSSVVRIEPALTITNAEIDRLLSALDLAGDLLHREDYATLFSYLTRKQNDRAIVPPRMDFSRPSASRAALSADGGERLGGYAFLIHPTTLDDLVQTSLSPALLRYDDSQMTAWNEWLAVFSRKCYEPGIAYHLPVLRSKAGGYVEGWLISCGLTPSQMVRLTRRERDDLISKYLDVARDLEVDMVGLGAFTSIVTRGGTDIDACGLHLTTGNSLTAMAATESLKLVARNRGIDLLTTSVGVIGSAGSVGRLVCRLLAPVCSHLVLFGNPSNPSARKNLEILSGELYLEALVRLRQGTAQGIAKPLREAFPTIDLFPDALLDRRDDQALRDLARFVHAQFALAGQAPPVVLSVDLERHLPRLGALVSATNQSEAFIDSALLAPGAIVCDAARPPAIRAALRPRKDVMVYAGGVMVLPEPIRFGRPNVLGFPLGTNLACLSECIALTMAGAKRSYSLGNRIPVAEAEAVYALARHHGFEVSICEEKDEVELRGLEAESVGHTREMS